MVVVGQALLNRYEDLWHLIENCAALLRGDDGQDESGELMALVEHATASHLGPWDRLPRDTWTQGRAFGAVGELRWRAYGPLLRAVLTVDDALADTGREEGGEEEKPGCVGRVLAPLVSTSPGQEDYEEQICSQLEQLGFDDVVFLSFAEPELEQIFVWRGDPYERAYIRSYLAPDGTATFVRYCSIKEQDHDTHDPDNVGNLPDSR